MLKKIKLPNIIITILIYTGAMLYTKETILLFYGSIFLCTIATGFCLIKRIDILKTFFKTKFFFWLTAVWVMYFIYAYIFEVYDVFNPERLIAIYVITIDTALLLQTLKREEMINEVIKCFAMSAILMMIHIVISEFEEIISGANRIGESGSGNVNSIAVCLGILSIGVFGKAFIDKNKKYMLLYALIVAFMLLTGSKKAIIIILITVAGTFILKNKWDLLKYVKLLLVVVLFFVIIFSNEYLYNIVGYRIEDFFLQLTAEDTGTVISHSTEERGSMLKEFPKLFVESPIVGSGWGYFSEYSGFGTYSHCNYTEMLITFGIFGTFLYYIMYISTLKKYFMYKKFAIQRVVPLITLIVILVCDMSSISFNAFEVYYISLFIAVYQISIIKKEKENEFKTNDV